MKTAVATFESFALPRQSHVKQIVYVGLSILALSVSCYVYFVGKIVFDVVARRSAEVAIRKEEGAINTLESSYLQQLRSLDLAEAGTLGLTESHSILYAHRDTTGTAVGMAHEI